MGGKMYTIPEEQLIQSLKHINIYAIKAYKRTDFCCDLSVYIDAGFDALEDCLRNFDLTRGVKFSTYVESRIHWSMIDVKRKYAKEQRNIAAYISYTQKQKEVRIQHQYIDNRLADLSPFVNKCADLFLCGYSARDIARKYGVTEENLIYHLRKSPSVKGTRRNATKKKLRCS